MWIFGGINAVPAFSTAFVAYIQTPFRNVVAFIDVSAELKRSFAQEALVKQPRVICHPESPHSGRKYNTLFSRDHFHRRLSCGYFAPPFPPRRPPPGLVLEGPLWGG